MIRIGMIGLRSGMRWGAQGLRRGGQAALGTTMMRRMTTATPPKAAIMIIGDEVLKGKVVDTNTPWLAKLLFSRGVDLVRVEVVRDDMQEIGESMHRMKALVGDTGFIFTSGGIGPTHDDMTYEAIAAASGRKLEVHQPTLELMTKFYLAKDPPIHINEGRLRMATLPERCEVLFTPGLWVPLCNVDGVYILPGIPRLFQAMVEGNKERFVGPASFSANLYTNVGEGDLAAALGKIAAENKSVQIGSYPRTADGGDYRVKLTLDSRDKAQIENVMTAVKGSIDILRHDISW